jgi:hypothetical protein
MTTPEHEETRVMDTRSFETSIEDVGDRIRPRIEDAKRRLGRLNGEVTGFIKDHPAACLLGAVALGYLVARVARSRS